MGNAIGSKGGNNGAKGKKKKRKRMLEMDNNILDESIEIDLEQLEIK